VAGVDYPATFAQLRRWFPADDACVAYLARLRWPAGFCCPRCGGNEAWETASGLWLCRSCRRKTSVTASTIFHRSWLPLTDSASGRGFELGKGAVEGARACRRRIAQELGIQGSYRSAGTSAGVAGLAASVASRWAVGHWTLVAHPAFSKRRMIPAEESICPRPTPCRAEAG